MDIAYYAHALYPSKMADIPIGECLEPEKTLNFTVFVK